MTAQILTSELSTLVQESKRKYPELRSAAEKSLADIKALPRTSEAQIAADINSRPAFVKPFLLACGTRNPKFAGSAVICLQRLIVSNALHHETLGDVLEALRECSTLALDIQLKVLQALPSLLQNYADALTGSLLIATFQVCFLLYANKTAVVSNTAAAALQQLVNTTFEKAAIEQGEPSEDSPPKEVSIGDGTVSVHGPGLDAYRVLDDICLLTEGQKPKYIQGAALVRNFGLELIASILASHADTIMAHPEQIHVLRIRLMPLIIRVLSEKRSFSTTVRTMRLLQLILSRLLFALASECEIALSLLNHMLDPDAAVLWKRALCLEVFRSLHSEPALMRCIYAHFDEEEERRNITRDHLGSLVRLASEKPAVIGLGQQSSIPSNHVDSSSEQAAAQTGGLIGSIGSPLATVDYNTPGISNQWSTMRVPCIEMLDKSEPPNMPATYIYSLALTCITTFSEGLARFLLPFTVPVESKVKRKQRSNSERRDQSNEQDRVAHERYSSKQATRYPKGPVNPLSLEGHVLYSQISTSAHMVDNCWPALLAASSTYLNATMDSENYHALIRSFQKFTQIAGLLGLATPRDAFLTTLGKHSIPPSSSSKAMKVPSTPTANGSESPLEVENQSNNDNDLSPSAAKSSGQQQQSAESTGPALNPRHLLCLRALLNLGIALGPVLGKSWLIIIETLQKVDLVIWMSRTGRQKPSDRSRQRADSQPDAEFSNDLEDLGLEIKAAETAASRMFESTSELPSEAFHNHLNCLRTLIRNDISEDPFQRASESLLSPIPASPRHQKIRSVSGISLDGQATARELLFLLDKLNEVIHSNISRVMQPETQESGWAILVESLTKVLISSTTSADVRIKAASTLNTLVVLTAVSEEMSSTEDRDVVRARSFDTLLQEINSLTVHNPNTRTSQNCETEIHRLALDALRSILEHCGDSLDRGWNSIFAIMTSIFDSSSSQRSISTYEPDGPRSISPKLVRSSFASLQLICSDFLSSVPFSSLLQLLHTLYQFSAQEQDLNISLTTATFFRNISDFLQRDNDNVEFALLSSDECSEPGLISLAKGPTGETSKAALMLLLLLRLAQLTTDSRSEVRHSALHTLFRILDACGDRLNPAGLRICFRAVIVQTLEANEAEYTNAKRIADPEQEKEVLDSWNETAVVLIEGISKFFAPWLDTFKDHQDIREMLLALLHHLETYLSRHELKVSKATYSGISKVLAEIDDLTNIGGSVVGKAWDLWANQNPAAHIDTSRKGSDNQDALLAYLECLGQILRLLGPALSSRQVESTLEQVRTTVTESSASAYSTDSESMTSVQKMALESLRKIPTNAAKAEMELLATANYFVTLAYEQDRGSRSTKQTFVALSKASMGLLESFVSHHLRDSRPGDALEMITQALRALAIPIHLKYIWRVDGKGAPPWSKATTTAVAILEMSPPTIQATQSTDHDSTAFWEVVVDLADGIISADHEACSDPTRIAEDEASDITAFSKLNNFIIPALGSASIPDAIRRKYTSSLFTNSLIHPPHPDDLALPGQDLLSGLRSTHIGRVQALPPTPRHQMSYLLLTHLFSLTAASPPSPSRTRLAQAAALYLILRTGLVLKAYILDQPLRGCMPQPRSEKREMLWVLRGLIELRSEPKAIPAAAEGVVSLGKRHLYVVYGLVVRALGVAWRDEVVGEALREVLVAVGEDFGV